MCLKMSFTTLLQRLFLLGMELEAGSCLLLLSSEARQCPSCPLAALCLLRGRRQVAGSLEGSVPLFSGCFLDSLSLVPSAGYEAWDFVCPLSVGLTDVFD